MDASNVNSPLKRLTPAVPTPNWNNECNTQHMDVDQETINNINLIAQNKDENVHSRESVISNTLVYATPSGSNARVTSVIRTPVRPERCDSNMSSTQASQSRIVGDVALTPTHSSFTPQPVNPHSAMAALTPMASGTTQAKNSIKLQFVVQPWTFLGINDNEITKSTAGQGLQILEKFRNRQARQAGWQSQYGGKIHRRNCVSTVSLGCELKLLDIYCKTRFSEYNPARFQGVVMKILEPRATALVFRSGKIVCTGARNEHDSYVAARKFARIIQKLGFPAKFMDFKIQNFIATADLRFPVRLEALQQAHGQFTSYEPELFPGLVYRMVRPRVVLLIFVNGKIVFTGGKTRNEINEALDIIYPILRSYRKS